MFFEYPLEINNLRKYTSCLPVDQHTPAAIEPILDKRIGCSKMLEQIFIVDVVYLDDMVLVRGKDFLVKRQAQHGEHMGDVGRFQSLLPAEGKNPRGWRSAGPLTCLQARIRMGILTRQCRGCRLLEPYLDPASGRRNEWAGQASRLSLVPKWCALVRS